MKQAAVPLARLSRGRALDVFFARMLSLWLGLASALGFASGCGPAEPNDELDVTYAGLAVAGPRRIVVLGSSTAAGVGVRRADSAWVERYRAYLRQSYPDLEVVNLAQGGATTYAIQPSDFVPPPSRSAPVPGRNIDAALALAPVAIVINLPTNDQQNGHSLAEQLANYERVLQRASWRAVPVWIATPQPRNFPNEAQRAELTRARDAIWQRFGPRVLDFWHPVAQSDGRIMPAFDSGDGVHLNDEGHARLADKVIEARIPASISWR